MTGERFNPTSRETKQPSRNQVEFPDGFSNASTTNQDTKSARRDLRFDSKRRTQTGGYPRIAGGREPKRDYEQWLRETRPDLSEGEIQILVDAHIDYQEHPIEWSSEEKGLIKRGDQLRKRADQILHKSQNKKHRKKHP